MKYSVFESCFVKQNDDTKSKELVYEHQFFYGDLSKIDFATDWRTKKVSGKRMQCKFIGQIDIQDFPVKYPLHFDSGKVLLKA